MREFFLCAVGSTMSRQLNLFGKPVVRKAGPYCSPSNRYEKFVNAYVASNPGLPLVEAKRKADNAWRETGNGENEEEVEMMLSAEASLEEKDKRLARSSFVVDKRGLEEAGLKKSFLCQSQIFSGRAWVPFFLVAFFFILVAIVRQDSKI